MLTFNCANCHAITCAPAPIESLDSGTTLICKVCGGSTVISLLTPNQYVLHCKRVIQQNIQEVRPDGGIHSGERR